MWGMFFGSLLMALEISGGIYRILLDASVWVFTFCLFSIFFVMKFVLGPPLWKPIGYEEFKNKIGKNAYKIKYLYIVNALLIFAVACLILVTIDKVFISG
jgi:hypothetical protein